MRHEHMTQAIKNEFVFLRAPDDVWEESSTRVIEHLHAAMAPNSLSVYLAGTYGERARLIPYMHQLEEIGLEVTSSWLRDEMLPLQESGDYRSVASVDTNDVLRARGLVLVSPVSEEWQGLGGRCTELGIALGLGKPIALIGRRENVFYHHPRVLQYANWDHYIGSLLDEMEHASAGT